MCHCTPNEVRHIDVIVQNFREPYPQAYDRSVSSSTPSSAVSNYMVAPREEPPSDPGSSADEGAPLLVGAGYTAREYCKGHSLQRRYPSHLAWSLVSSIYKKFVATYGPPELLMRLALGKVDPSPFGDKEISQLKADSVGVLGEHGLKVMASPKDSSRHLYLSSHYPSTEFLCRINSGTKKSVAA